MNYQVKDLCGLMEKLAPLELALEWDNVGLQIGNPKHRVDKVLVTLTVTPEVVEKAQKQEVDLIIAHHPLIFQPLTNIRSDQPLGQLIWQLIHSDINLYVSHTNLDRAPAGLNEWLGEKLLLHDMENLRTNPFDEIGLGRLGTLSPRTLKQLAREVEIGLNHPIKIVGDPNQTVEKVAVVGGSGGSFFREAKAAGAQVLITGDVSYHQALDALSIGLCVLDGGHHGTEKIMVSKVAAYLREKCPGLVVIEEASANPFEF